MLSFIHPRVRSFIHSFIHSLDNFYSTSSGAQLSKEVSPARPKTIVFKRL